jgi:hypothetical protein
MKKNVCIVFSLLLSIAISGQTSDKGNLAGTSYFPLPEVERRIELLSIVFRLAGNMEYNDEIFRRYPYAF